MSQEQTNGLSQLQKLQALQSESKEKSKKANMSSFENIVGIYLGTEPKEHFPKLLDTNGKKLQEEKNGRTIDKRSDKSDGWTYTFSEFGTCKKIMIVLSNRLDVRLMEAYKLSGLGYDIKGVDMFFIEKDTNIIKF